jgi:hypothetical protein
MNNYPPSEQFVQREEVVLENPSFYGRMKNRAKNAAYSMGRGLKSVGSYAYNQIPGRNGNFNVLTQTGNNRSAFDLATGTNSFERDQNRFQNQVDASYSMGRGIKGVGSYAYNKIPGRNGNYNPFTAGLTKTPFGAVSSTARMQNLGAAASGLFSMLRGQGGRTQKRKRKLRKIKTNKSKKRRITRKRN